ncbi:MAG: proton-conducting transporter membrane subunit [Haloarculaceae archaeon]
MSDLLGINPELLPALLIAVPILAATLPLALGVLRERVGWAVSVVVLAFEALLATLLAYAIYVQNSRVVHVLGGEAFGRKDVVVAGTETENFIVGIELVGDALSGLVVVVVAVVALAVLAFTRRGGPRGNAFYSGYLLLTGGLMGVAVTGDVFNLFVFLEITGLTTYALIASDSSADSAVAALKYLVIGTASASMYLVGVGYLFVRTGTLNMVDLSRSLAGDPTWIDGALYTDPLVAAAFGFIAIGLMTKVAIFPLHTWQPDAYSEAPDAVTIFISALVSTVSAYAFARLTLFVFTPDFFAVNPLLIDAVLVMAGLSVVAGSALAASQRRIKRMFAYSSVAQFGLVIIAIGVAVHPAGGEEAVRFAIYGAAFHLVAHALIKGGLFATVGAIAESEDARTIDEYAGLARRRPFLSGAMAVLGLAIIGVPPTAGFIGKWYVAVAAVQTGLWPVVLVVFASTVLTLLYVARILEKLYFDHPDETAATEAAADPAVVADGGESENDGLNTGRSLGMVGLAIGAAILAVVLGFAGAEIASALDPVVDAVVDSAPAVDVGDGSPVWDTAETTMEVTTSD